MLKEGRDKVLFPEWIGCQLYHYLSLEGHRLDSRLKRGSKRNGNCEVTHLRQETQDRFKKWTPMNTPFSWLNVSSKRVVSELRWWADYL